MTENPTLNPTAVVDFLMNTSEEIENHLNLPVGSISNLIEEPDYVLLLKMIGVIEPVLNDLIRHGFTRPSGGLGGRDRKAELKEVLKSLERLPLDGRPGRVQLALALGVISPTQSEFVQALATLRNSYAHNIAAMHRPLLEVVQRLMGGNKKLAKVLTHGMVNDVTKVVSGDLKFTVLVVWMTVLSHWMRELKQPQSALFEAFMKVSADHQKEG